MEAVEIMNPNKEVWEKEEDGEEAGNYSSFPWSSGFQRHQSQSSSAGWSFSCWTFLKGFFLSFCRNGWHMSGPKSLVRWDAWQRRKDCLVWKRKPRTVDTMCSSSLSKGHSIHSGKKAKNILHRWLLWQLPSLYFSQIARVAPQVYLSAATALVPSALEGLALTLVSTPWLFVLSICLLYFTYCDCLLQYQGDQHHYWVAYPPTRTGSWRKGASPWQPLR